MNPPIDAFLREHDQLTTFLLGNGEISLANSVEHHYRKIFLLSCASYHERQITDAIKIFINKHSNDIRIFEFARAKGIERQYHTYFDWKQTNNINSFLALFGADFKEAVVNEIKEKKLKNHMEAFLILGAERNLMVHGNFLTYTLDKTFNELKSLAELSAVFVDFLTHQFSD